MFKQLTHQSSNIQQFKMHKKKTPPMQPLIMLDYSPPKVSKTFTNKLKKSTKFASSPPEFALNYAQ